MNTLDQWEQTMREMKSNIPSEAYFKYLQLSALVRIQEKIFKEIAEFVHGKPYENEILRITTKRIGPMDQLK